jgi:pimeloyl-ACP methyl ester carboxylesterase
MRRAVVQSVLVLALAWAVIVVTSPPPADAGALTLEATFTSGIQNGWVRVERYRDADPNLVQETFPPDGRGDQTGQRATFFGSARPSSSRFLLHHAPGWNTGTGTPVLLVHGANQDADLAWADPNENGAYGCGRTSCPSTGLMQALSADGRRVFAISFAHKNGAGAQWTEQLANAIDVVRQKTGAAKVDVIGWSKGAFNARMYAASVNPAWGTDYRGDVRRLILLGSPNDGADGSFRHGWTYTFTVYPQCGGAINGPVAHDAIVCYGAWWAGSQWTYSSAYFPGSAEMLKRWDHVHGLPTWEQDWWTTYHGGWGYYTHSQGIDAYLGASKVDAVRTAGIPAGVRVHNLCGDQADIAGLHNEHTGPSDGVVFVASCLDRVGVSGGGSDATVAVNHLELGWDAPAVSRIRTWLDAP